MGVQHPLAGVKTIRKMIIIDTICPTQGICRAAMKLFNIKIKNITETDIVAALMERYREVG